MEVNEVENELKHWGILGMKWGIRNYQNPDGSLTPEGRIRYGVGPARSTGALLKGINDAGSLSNEELYKMSKRYKAQAEYLQNMNEFLKQERYMKQQLTPERKPKSPSAIGNFMKNVFGKPIEGFLAQNVNFGLGLLGYEILKNENPEVAASYFTSVSGLRMNNDKKPFEKFKEEAANARNRKNAVNDNKEWYENRQHARDNLRTVISDPNISKTYKEEAVRAYEFIYNEKFDPTVI